MRADDPKPTVISCGPFRIRVYYYRLCKGVEVEEGWRAEIAGAWTSETHRTEKDAKWCVADKGYDAIKPLLRELKKLNEKSKNRPGEGG